MSSRIEQIIEEIEEYVDSCKYQPLSTTKIVVNKEELEELLRDQGFLRLHKSYLVNMAYLDTLQSTGARLTDGTALPVSTRSYRVSKQRFLAWKGRQVC